jgi:hypothetical protein
LGFTPGKPAVLPAVKVGYYEKACTCDGFRTFGGGIHRLQLFALGQGEH